MKLAVGSDARWHNIAILTTKNTPYRCSYKSYLLTKTGLHCLFIIDHLQDQCSVWKKRLPLNILLIWVSYTNNTISVFSKCLMSETGYFKLIGGLMPSSVHSWLRTGRILGSGSPQSVSESNSKIWKFRINISILFSVDSITSSMFSSGMPHESPCTTMASYSLEAVDFRTCTCVRPRKIAKLESTFGHSFGTWINWQNTLMLDTNLYSFFWPLISSLTRRKISSAKLEVSSNKTALIVPVKKDFFNPHSIYQVNDNSYFNFLTKNLDIFKFYTEYMFEDIFLNK